MQLSPVSSSAIRFTSKDSQVRNSEKPNKLPRKNSELFGEKAIYEPLFQEHGAEFLQEAVQQYIQAKDGLTQGKAHSWIHQLLNRGISPSPTGL